MSSCRSCNGTATSGGGSGAKYPPHAEGDAGADAGGGGAGAGAGGGAGEEMQIARGGAKMQIVCHYDFEIEGKHFKGGTTRSESHAATALPPSFAGSDIKCSLQQVDRVHTTDGLQLKLFYNEDVFGPNAKLGRLLDGPHDIAMIEVHGKYHYLARTEPILGGRLGLQVINSRQKTLLTGQGDVVTDDRGEMVLYLSFNIVYPWLNCG